MNHRSGRVGQQRARRLEQRVGAGEREARRDGVAGPALAVPALGQLQPLVVGALGRGEQVLAQDPVGQHQPGGDPQPDPGRLGEQRVHGRGEVRAEDQRGRGAGPHQAGHEVGGHRGGVRRVGEPGLLRAARTSPASRAAASRARRSPGPAGSARGCRRSPGSTSPSRRSTTSAPCTDGGERLARHDHPVLARRGRGRPPRAGGRR